jgi:AraC family transcriptional regulator, exoenzyme S synthesis regulatory protein ExsA
MSHPPKKQKVERIIHLPGDTHDDARINEEQIIMEDYTAQPGSIGREKAILGKNAISLVIQGKKTIRFAEMAVNTNEGEFFFLSAGNCLVSMDFCMETPFRSLLIFFDDAVLADFYRKFDALIGRIKGVNPHPQKSFISFSIDPFVDSYMRSLGLLIGSGRLSREMKQLKFEELMLHLLELHPASILGFRPQQKDPDESKIRKAVGSNILNNITVEELAFLCNMSLSTFKRKFSKIFGASPSKWILLRKMEMAKDLLLRDNEKPGAIYYKIGYETHSSFTQSFKQVYGITPRDFRQKNLNVPQKKLNVWQ